VALFLIYRKSIVDYFVFSTLEIKGKQWTFSASLLINVTEVEKRLVNAVSSIFGCSLVIDA
jgi:hypothetical protein